MKKLLIVTDVWSNVNGVVTSLQQVKEILDKESWEVTILHPQHFRTIQLPTYHEIKLVMATRRRVAKAIDAANPDYIHIATEGTLGFLARLACIKHGWKFTTSYHTNLPDYVKIRIGFLKTTTYSYLRWFHKPSQCVMVSTQSLKAKLEVRGFQNVSLVPLGVDVNFFKKSNSVKRVVAEGVGPIFAFVGRVAPEKNVDAFLRSDLSGTKIVIGDGPERKTLQNKYASNASIKFLGYQFGTELVNILSQIDVLVFPSTTDTLGLIILEALACNVPVAAYNVQGPKDIITQGVDGFVGDDLAKNALNCLSINRTHCREKALHYSAENWVAGFVNHIVPKNN